MLHDIEAFVIRPVACGLGIVSQRDLFTGTVVLKEERSNIAGSMR